MVIYFKSSTCNIINTKIGLIIALIFLLSSCKPHQKAIIIGEPNYRSHSHNDYRHKRPLYDALENGISSVEIDIYRFAGKLWVCHWPTGIIRFRKIQDWYLEPIRKILNSKDGFIYKKGEPFYIMIEMKTKTKRTFPLLKKVLAQYKDILTTYSNDSIFQKPIVVSILGNKDDDYWLKDSLRFYGIELSINYACDSLNPYLYTQFRMHAGSPNNLSTQYYINAIECAHKQHRRIRANAGEDIEYNWKALLISGIDFIHTDDLIGVNKFLKNR